MARPARFSPFPGNRHNELAVSTVSLFAPAKLNLFLAVMGRRADGFHELVSVAAPLDFGDRLHVEPADVFSLCCTDPGVPCDQSNLVLKAARVFAEATGWAGGAKFTLEKNIPVGAGLGGGSSNAVAALRALNRLTGDLLPAGGFAAAAAALGSDCPLFLHDGPVVMRGRGERVEPLAAAAAARLRGRRVLVFKPGFGIATAWAYAQLAARGAGAYLPAAEAESRLAAWIEDDRAPAEELLWNQMEEPAFSKFVALPTLCRQIESAFGLRPRMSGSGSACFVFLGEAMPVAPLVSAIRTAWGAATFIIEAKVT